MLASPRWLPLAASIALVAGCVTPPAAPTTPPRPRTAASSAPGARVAPVPVGLAASPGAALPSPAGTLPAAAPSAAPSAPTVAGASVPPAPLDLAGATLTGKVKAPASLIANNGAGLISDRGGSIIANNGGGLIANNGGGLIANNGGGLVSNNGGGYRLAQAAAPEQFFLPGARVEVLDAAGNPIPGPDGAPLATTTTADGTFAFRAPLPTRHVILRATPSGGTGALSRLVATGVRAADVDVASSVVASYVIDQYVSTQPDRQATLDKLPARVEADTVALAAAALSAAPPPVSLESSALVAAATALRRADQAFDSQMETVKKILIAAGVSNLGAGLPATEVYMRRLFETDIAADGTVYTYASDDGIIWRVSPDGRLAPVAGTGLTAPADEPVSRAGRKAAECALAHVWALQVDDLGRPIVSEDKHGIWRLEPDGTITELHGVAALEAAFGKGYLARGVYLRGDATLVALEDGAIWALPQGGSKTKLADAPGVRASMGLVELPGRNRWLARFFGQVVAVSTTEPPKDLVADDDPRIAIGANGSRHDPSMDVFGNFFYVAAADQKIHRLAPDGTDEAIADRGALRHGLAWARTGHDGKVYLSDCDMGDNLGGAILRRVEAPGGASSIVAGIDGLPRGFTADGRISLLYPKGLDVAPDGTIFLSDAGALLEVPPGGAPKVVAAKGTLVPAAMEGLQFTGVRRLASGKLAARALGANRELILRQDDAGEWAIALSQTENWGNPWNIAMHAWDAAPDGTVVASKHVYDNAGFKTTAEVVRRKPGDLLPQTLVPVSAGFEDIAKLTFAPDGTLWMRASKGLGSKPGRYKIADDGTVTEAPEGSLAPEAQDAAGRLYEGDAPTYTLANYGDRRIRRRNADGAAEVVAGPGSRLLGGTALDDSIGWAEDLRFDAAGNLYVRDVLRRQVRRIPKERL